MSFNKIDIKSIYRQQKVIFFVFFKNLKKNLLAAPLFIREKQVESKKLAKYQINLKAIKIKLKKMVENHSSVSTKPGNSPTDSMKNFSSSSVY